MMVANHAEALNGLLYLSGGGFTDLFRPATEPPSYVNNFGVAISILIPDKEANITHAFAIQLKNGDGTEQLSEAKGTFNVNNPPNTPEGTELFVTLAVQFNVVFPSPGLYQVIATIDNDGDSKSRGFRVHDIVRSA